ncbi:MAG: glycosyltransferase family 2 protein [Archangium sp.]
MNAVDVVVPVYRDVPLTLRCLESVLTHSGARLRRLIIVDDASPEPGMRAALERVRARDGRVRLLVNHENQGFIRSCNRGVSLRCGDVVILNSDTEVTTGWLDELMAGAALDGVAAVCPLSNNATLCSVPTWGEKNDAKDVSIGLRSVERFTEMPTGVGFCMLLRDEVLQLIGLFDEAYGRGYNEENDWCQRARAAGFRTLRANHAVVFHHGEVSFAGARAQLDRVNARRLVSRYPNYLDDNRRFAQSASAHAAAISHRAVHRLRVAWHRLGRTVTERAMEVVLADVFAAANIEVVPAETAAAEVRLLTGTPDVHQTRAAMSSQQSLVFVPLDVIALEGRLLSGDASANHRAAAFVLSRASTVVFSHDDARTAFASTVGDPTDAHVLALGPAPVATRDAPEWVMPTSDISPAEVSLLLECWFRRRPVSARLSLWCSEDRVPAVWRPQFASMGVELQDGVAAFLPRCLAAAAVVAPVRAALLRPEFVWLSGAGQQVVPISRALTFETSRRGNSAPFSADWRSMFDAVARTAPRVTERAQWVGLFESLRSST